MQTNELNLLVSKLEKGKILLCWTLSNIIDDDFVCESGDDDGATDDDERDEESSLKMMIIVMMMTITWGQSEVPTHAGQDCSSTRELLGSRLSWG